LTKIFMSYIIRIETPKGVIKVRLDRAVIAYELARREWRHQNLSEISGISRATLSAAYCGKSIAEATAVKIANALGMKVDELLEAPRLPVYRHRDEATIPTQEGRPDYRTRGGE
jgi:transcriptional regulator with XRE-family HTH domain